MVLKIGNKGSIFFRAGKIIRAQKIASVKKLFIIFSGGGR